MGIVNATPDSFSDGGRYFAPDAAVRHALELRMAGAAILDIGGESTRPGSDAVDTTEQIRRVVPVIEAVVAGEKHRAGTFSSNPLLISVDTADAGVARAAIGAGANIVNDITAVSGDPAMLPLLLERNVGVCVMHMKGVPRTMQDAPHYEDVVAEIDAYLEERLNFLVAAGIDRMRIAIDPGIGFGKTTEHNRLLIENIDRFFRHGCTVLVGHSRKRFLGDLYPQFDRDRATVEVSRILSAAGVHVLRVHDVAANRC
ncbi:MAG TPA: dihydropteroate synthase [Planctomycetaceae bacterium]|nr:dihydropteroate synthase [Planctomycetaceae bacterium]